MSAEIETLHVPFEKWLRAERIPFVRARSDRESTLRAGWPDFTLTLAGRALMIEFKDKAGKLSPEQVECIAELNAAGNRVHVLRDLAVAVELATAWRSTIGEIATLDPAGKGSTAAREPGLVRFGAGVFRRTEGRLEHVRVATPADSALPQA